MSISVVNDPQLPAELYEILFRPNQSALSQRFSLNSAMKPFLTVTISSPLKSLTSSSSSSLISASTVQSTTTTTTNHIQQKKASIPTTFLLKTALRIPSFFQWNN